MARTNAIRIGTYASRMLRPWTLLLTGARNPGMLPKMISRSIGKPTPQIGPHPSRRDSFPSVTVSLRRAGMVAPDMTVLLTRSGPGCEPEPDDRFSIATGAPKRHRPRGRVPAAGV